MALNLHINTLAFNQDYTCLALASNDAFTVYNCDPFGACFTHKDDGASIIEMLFSTSLIAIVGLGDKPQNSNRKLKILNTKKNTTICEITFPTCILFVKMNRKRLIVALVDQILIYDVSCMKLLHTIETPPTSIASIVADLSTNEDSILAFQQTPLTNNSNKNNDNDTDDDNGDNDNNNSNISNNNGNALMTNLGSKPGEVIIFDALNILPINIIECHKSNLQKLTLSNDGSLLATASIKGTIIRVFNTQTGEKVCEFRRGSYNATISSLSFNVNNTILSCSSNTGTIHFFKLTNLSKLIAPAITSSVAPISNPASNVDSTTNLNHAEENNSSVQLPKQTIMTDEENLEISQLISDANPSSNKKLLSSSTNKKSTLKNFFWSQSKNYLPSQINSILEPKRDFAFIKLNNDVESNVAVVENNCYVATYSGEFFVYSIPQSIGESSLECVLLKQYQLKNSESVV